MNECILTEDEFDEKFTLVKNNVVGGACFGDERFETFGADWDFISRQDPKRVWTCVDADGTWCYSPGFHLVNRLYYIMTEEPWTDDIIEVQLEGPEDEE